ncbi:hypothetical protein [Mesobacillus subterraneus]|uniref:Uncharacterized protein n=1 Tax=Mesobacillus subterraneus TaxID=285983 RepID=A0A427TP54_9BACI|nr:hypothetical protein [Mesobacillus subterraneus]RSD26123.1 hypothetical protein EJA10_14955 [Mesobacillus subterraneus]
MNMHLYQAKAGDGSKKKGLRRTKSYFTTPEEAVSEAFALKGEMDSRYANEIEWDYKGSITGKSDKLKFLKGYLNGNKESTAFYLEILRVEHDEQIVPASPIKPKSVTKEDRKVFKKVVEMIQLKNA